MEDIENVDDEGSDVNEEDIAAIKELRNYRKRRPSKQSATGGDTNHIQLGEVGVDSGYRDISPSSRKVCRQSRWR